MPEIYYRLTGSFLKHFVDNKYKWFTYRYSKGKKMNGYRLYKHIARMHDLPFVGLPLLTDQKNGKQYHHNTFIPVDTCVIVIPYVDSNKYV
jgi:hypothetical protein